MNKAKLRGGFTLIEMLITVVILVMLVVGIGTGMNTGMQVYRDSIFESDSSSLAGILNNSLGDILRYSVDVRAKTPSDVEAPDYVDFLFTSYDYGIRDGYFCKTEVSPSSTIDTIQLGSLDSTDTKELVNTGAYPNLKITDFTISYTPPATPVDGLGRGGYFEIGYVIRNRRNEEQKRQINYTVRLMNAE